MGRKAGDPLDDEVARQVCQRNHAKVFIAGSIGSLGSQYLINLKAVNCSTGDVLAQQQTQVGRKEDVIRELGEQGTLCAASWENRWAVSRSSIFPSSQATTSSLEALQAYTIGSQYLFQLDNQSAIVPLQRAIELDPEFAVAYRRLACVYGNSTRPG